MSLGDIIHTIGMPGIAFILFILTGTPIGIVIPADSMLVVAGLLSSQNIFSLPVLLLISPLFAFLGDWVGFTVGRMLGPEVIKNSNSKLFRKKHIDKAKRYFDQHDAQVFIFVKYIPVVRTLAPLIAGALKVNKKVFVTYSTLGVVIWTTSLLLMGFFLGELIPGIEHYLVPVSILVVIVSLLPHLPHSLK